ncbi:unnamed protein product [Rhizoctonia solani]|uniref:C2H2-type domain-containing protein n=1 Tax=Rhizoctonia solani TaxID=456999 RepID=A0A8H3C5I1_9AGAM|nr:unnamed protein product [Rhizoctonia solani]
MSWTKVCPWSRRRGKRLLSNPPELTEPPLTDWNILNEERINDEDLEDSGEILPLSIVSELRQCSYRGRALRVSNPDHSLDMHSRARSYLCPFPRCNTGFFTEITMRYHFLTHQVGPLEAYRPSGILQPESEQESRASGSISSLASYHSEPAPIKHQPPFGDLTINQPQKPHSLVDTTESRHGGSASICLMAPASVNAHSGDPLGSVLSSTHSTLTWSRLPPAHSSPGPELSNLQPGSTLVCKRASALTRSPELSTGSELPVSESCEFSPGLDSLSIKRFLSPLDAHIGSKTSQSVVDVSTPPLVVDPEGFSASPTLSLRKSLYGLKIGRIAHHSSPQGQVVSVQTITSHSSSAVDEKKPSAPSIPSRTYKHRAERVGCLYVPVWRYGYHTNPCSGDLDQPCIGIDDGPPFNVTNQSLVCVEGPEKSENLGYIKLYSGFPPPTNVLAIYFPYNYLMTISRQVVNPQNSQAFRSGRRMRWLNEARRG